MNRFLILLLILFNLSLTLYIWQYWRQFRKLEKWNSSKIFVPTNDWQPIEKNQTIPRGLHVRVNLQTGEREAKLLKSENGDNVIINSTSLSVHKNENAHQFKWEASGYLVRNDESTYQSDVNQRFRSYDDLKKELGEINMQMKTDMEVLLELLTMIENQPDGKSWCTRENENEVSILNNLEILLHQIDNAEEFAKRNGMIEVVIPCLKSNSTKLKTMSARVLGAAAQNNGRVQIAALKSGAINPLLKIIAFETDFEARSSSISSLSCMIRLFPLAEWTLMKEGGIQILISLFDENTDEAFKLQMKVVNLFYDLLTEESDTIFTVDENSQHNLTTSAQAVEELNMMTEKKRQYSHFDLKNVLIEQSWCSKLGHLLVTKVIPKDFHDEIEVNNFKIDHDVVEKVINALLPLASECKYTLKKEAKLSSVLRNLLRYYRNLSSRDDFFTSIYNVLELVNVEVDEN